MKLFKQILAILSTNSKFDEYTTETKKGYTIIPLNLEIIKLF